MALSRHEFQLDNGNKFYIRRYDAFLSVEILGEVQKCLVLPLTAILEAKDTTINLESFNSVIEKASKSLDGPTLVSMTKLVLNPNFISVSIDNGEPQRLEEGPLNLAVDGVFDVIALFVEVLVYNYKDLFTRGPTLIGRVQSNTVIH